MCLLLCRLLTSTSHIFMCTHSLSEAQHSMMSWKQNISRLKINYHFLASLIQFCFCSPPCERENKFSSSSLRFPFFFAFCFFVYGLKIIITREHDSHKRTDFPRFFSRLKHSLNARLLFFLGRNGGRRREGNRKLINPFVCSLIN